MNGTFSQKQSLNILPYVTVPFTTSDLTIKLYNPRYKAFACFVPMPEPRSRAQQQSSRYTEALASGGTPWFKSHAWHVQQEASNPSKNIWGIFKTPDRCSEWKKLKTDCEQGKAQAEGGNQTNQLQPGRQPPLSFWRAKGLTCRQYRRELLGAPYGVKHFHSPNLREKELQPR